MILGVDPSLVRIFQWMMHSLMGPSMTSKLHSVEEADQYQKARAAAAAAEHLAPIRPPPPSTGEGMTWIPPITPPSHGQGFTSSAPTFHQWDTPPSWEYLVSRSRSGGSHHQWIHNAIQTSYASLGDGAFGHFFLV
ncbi:hypothetical protein PIB30_016266 [Stylosanthes scabra]|uniref:Uncharacterized protein n=1 Tax=Stylosanthes scabra TaxID=79078 RepID=A0ABU6Y984_9FABA|nr:hypothetical protein [Stylosanthes scabra]